MAPWPASTHSPVAGFSSAAVLLDASGAQFSREEIPDDHAIDTKRREPQRSHMVQHAIQLPRDKRTDDDHREIGSPSLSEQETSPLCKRESGVHKGANTQCLQQLILNREDLRQEPMNRAILRVYVDHMEPLLDDKQMILIQQEQPAGSKCSQQQSLNQVIRSEQRENQWGGPPHSEMFCLWQTPTPFPLPTLAP